MGPNYNWIQTLLLVLHNYPFTMLDLESTETVTIPDGRVMTKNDLLIESIKLDPENARAYFRLGRRLSHNETVALSDGRTMTKRDLYLEGLKYDPTNPELYYCLGVNLVNTKTPTVTLPDGRVLSERELYI